MQSSITFALPAGFQQQNGWFFAKTVSPHWKTDWVSSGLIKFFAPVPAQGDLSEAARAAWNQYIPPEIRGKRSELVIRRYVGDGLRAFYVHGRGQETGSNGESWFAMHVVDCGSTWQPVLVVSKFEETGREGIESTIQYEIHKGFDLAEPLVQAMRCAGPRNEALYDAATMVGHYYFGSGAFQAYVNIYTGGMTSSSINYAGEYELRANGTAKYAYSSATSYYGSSTNFGTDGGEGTWKVEGDMLTIAIKNHTPYIYRLASMTTLADAKVGVLLDPTDWWLPPVVSRGKIVTTKAAAK